MPDSNSLLIVEDTPSLARTFQAYLRPVFDRIELTDTGAGARQIVSERPPECILLDLKLPDGDGLDLLDHWVAAGPDVPIIIITANGSLGAAVDAIRRGAVDFVVKPTSRERLQATMRKALERHHPQLAVSIARAREAGPHFCDFVGSSDAMCEVYDAIEKASSSKASVFITGETGTGKELAARALHQLSPRRHAQFVSLNCGAIPSDLLESEIFGHVKGAFTGATSDRVGAAELADNGSLFLDELTEMPLALQPKLLRFLQTGEFTRVGETRYRRANIRFIAATNQNPGRAVRDGRLREDLYYRLYVIPLHLPQLRQRGHDVVLLAKEFLARSSFEEQKKFSGFSRSAEHWLNGYHWPGNVRELENLIRRIVVLNAGGEIDETMLSGCVQPALDPDMLPSPDPVLQAPVAVLPVDHVNDNVEPLWQSEKKAIEKAIVMCGGNITAAADRLQIDPSTIHRKRALWAGHASDSD